MSCKVKGNVIRAGDFYKLFSTGENRAINGVTKYWFDDSVSGIVANCILNEGTKLYRYIGYSNFLDNDEILEFVKEINKNLKELGYRR